MFEYDEDKHPIIRVKPEEEIEVATTEIPGGYYNLATGCYEIPKDSNMITLCKMERALGVETPVNKQVH